MDPAFVTSLDSTLDVDDVLSDCADRVVCGHISEDFLVYDDNVMLAAAEVLTVTLDRYARAGAAGHAAREVAALVRMAREEQCGALRGRCPQERVEECANMV